ncbi:caspase-7-like [Ornithodoros turicata]|uniref:caspase-7-like n=1 Tax=Ornithodoros turicata TaxID=34597 RepID=UPI0031398E56
MADQRDALVDSDGTSTTGARPCGPPPPQRSESSYRVDAMHIPDSMRYMMNHARRGRCLIFNFESFHGHQAPGQREGTDVDVREIKRVFYQLGFEVEVHTNRKARDMEDMLWDEAMENTGAEVDCFVCFVLSHGQLGKIYASDDCIKLQALSRPFTSSVAKHLQGKPKIFFVQACQEVGGDYNAAIDGEWSYDIPSHPDIFFAFSTPPGYYSWRNPRTGSYFIQTLCKVLDDSITAEGTSPDLETLVIGVNRYISFKFESYVPTKEKLHEKKQTCCYITTLTKKVVFSKRSTGSRRII